MHSRSCVPEEPPCMQAWSTKTELPGPASHCCALDSHCATAVAHVRASAVGPKHIQAGTAAEPTARASLQPPTSQVPIHLKVAACWRRR
mmetsp:Transcript_15852/g.41729  ORF Transcript_15852/g.41729 Transcript_15852/m.41729 type:complete len:89 (-) Transcript_15852:130-396(-)